MKNILFLFFCLLFIFVKSSNSRDSLQNNVDFNSIRDIDPSFLKKVNDSLNDVVISDHASDKNAILNEFKKKLLEEEKIQQELKKNKTLTNEDLDGLVNTNESTIKDIFDSVKKINSNNKNASDDVKYLEEENIDKEEDILLKEVERIKIQEEELKNVPDSEDKLYELKKSKDLIKDKLLKLFNKRNNLKEDIEGVNKNYTDDSAKSDDINFDNLEIDPYKIRSNNIFDITDTGVSESFLYSKEYRNLMNKKTTINRNDIMKDSDIPIISIKEKNIINFNTSDIPDELLTYKRTEQNKHIPSIISTYNIQNIAKKAIINGDLSVVRGIVEQTKDPDFLVDNNRTLLSYSIDHKNYIISRYLIYTGASLNKVDDNGNSPLHTAVLNFSYDIVSLLVDNGADINSRNNDGNTPLLLSILTNQEDIVIYFLKSGVNLNIKNESGDDALSLCVKNNKRRLQQYIKEIIRIEEEKK